MTFSVVFLILGLITLLIGWNAGSDPVLWVSIGSTVLAGVLLAVSYLQERRMRLQADTGTGYAAPASPPPALMPEASVIAEAEEPEMEAVEEEEPEEFEEMVAPAAKRSTAKRTPSKPKAKSPAKSKAKPKAKAKTTAKPKAPSKARAKTAAKSSAAKSKARPKAKTTARKSTRSS